MKKPKVRKSYKTVYLKRNDEVLEDFPTASLVSLIKDGWLHPTDWLSTDRKIWVRLNKHPQLASYFKTTHEKKIESELGEIAGLLKEINKS